MTVNETDEGEINQRLNECDEWQKIVEIQPSFAEFNGTEDVGHLIRSLEVSNSFLHESELYEILQVLIVYNKKGKVLLKAGMDIQFSILYTGMQRTWKKHLLLSKKQLTIRE